MDPPLKMPVIPNQGHRVRNVALRRGGSAEEDWAKFTNEFTNPDSLLNQTDNKILDELKHWEDALGGVFDPNKNGLKQIFEDFAQQVGRTFEGVADKVKSELDPELNGVNDAFRKFGNDFNGAFEEIGQQILGKLEEGWQKYSEVFKPLGDLLVNVADKDWWEKTMKDPETYFFLAQCIISCSAVFLGPAGVALASGVVAATRIISKAAQGQDIEYTDLIQMALCMLPTGRLVVAPAQRNATSFAGMVMNGVRTSLNGIRSADPNAAARAAGQGLCGLVAAGQEYDIIPPVNSQATYNMVDRASINITRAFQYKDLQNFMETVRVYERDKQYDGREEFTVKEDDLSKPLPDVQVTSMVKDPSGAKEDYVDFPPLPPGYTYSLDIVKNSILAGKYIPTIKQRDKMISQTKTQKMYEKKDVVKYRDRYTPLNSYTIREVQIDKQLDAKTLASLKQKEAIALRQIAAWEQMDATKRANARADLQDPTDDIPLDKIEFTDIKTGKVYSLTRPTKPNFNAPAKIGNIATWKNSGQVGFSKGDIVAASIKFEDEWQKDPETRFFKCLETFPVGAKVNLPNPPNMPALGKQPAKTGETFESMSQQAFTGKKWIEISKEDANAANTGPATFVSPLEDYQNKVAEYRTAYAAKLANDRLFSQLARDRSTVEDRLSKDFPVSSYNDGKNWIEIICRNEVNGWITIMKSDQLRNVWRTGELKDFTDPSSPDYDLARKAYQGRFQDPSINTSGINVDYMVKYHATYKTNYFLGPNFFNTVEEGKAYYDANPDLYPGGNIFKKRYQLQGLIKTDYGGMTSKWFDAQTINQDEITTNDDLNLGFGTTYYDGWQNSEKFWSDPEQNQRAINSYRKQIQEYTNEYDEEILNNPNFPTPSQYEDFLDIKEGLLRKVEGETITDKMVVDDVLESSDQLPFIVTDYGLNKYKQLALHMTRILKGGVVFDTSEQHVCNTERKPNTPQETSTVCLFSKKPAAIVPKTDYQVLLAARDDWRLGKLAVDNPPLSWKELVQRTKDVLTREYNYEDDSLNVTSFEDRSKAESAIYGTSRAFEEGQLRNNFANFVRWVKLKAVHRGNESLGTIQAGELTEPGNYGSLVWLPIYKEDTENVRIPAATANENKDHYGIYNSKIIGEKKMVLGQVAEDTTEEVRTGIATSASEINYPAFMAAFNDNIRNINSANPKPIPGINATISQLVEAINYGERKEIQQKGADPTKIAEVRNTLDLKSKIEDAYVDKMLDRVKNDYMGKPISKVGSVTKRIDPWDTYQGLEVKDRMFLKTSDVEKKAIESFQRGAILLAGEDPNFFNEYTHNGMKNVIDSYMSLAKLFDTLEPGKNYEATALSKKAAFDAQCSKNREANQKIRSDFEKRKKDELDFLARRELAQLNVKTKLELAYNKNKAFNEKNQAKILASQDFKKNRYKYDESYVTDEKGIRRVKYSLKPEFDPVAIKAKEEAEALRLKQLADKKKLEDEQAELARQQAIAAEIKFQADKKLQEEQAKKNVDSAAAFLQAGERLQKEREERDAKLAADAEAQKILPQFPDNFETGLYLRDVVVNGTFQANHPVVVAAGTVLTSGNRTMKMINGVMKDVPFKNVLAPPQYIYGTNGVNIGLEKVFSKPGEKGHPLPINQQYQAQLTPLENAREADKLKVTEKAAEDIPPAPAPAPPPAPAPAPAPPAKIFPYDFFNGTYQRPYKLNSGSVYPPTSVTVLNGKIKNMTLITGRVQEFTPDTTQFNTWIFPSLPGELGHPVLRTYDPNLNSVTVPRSSGAGKPREPNYKRRKLNRQ
jgi:hypothetical protein